MKQLSLKNRGMAAMLTILLAVPIGATWALRADHHRAVDALGRYFVQDFEDNIPMQKPESDTLISVEGEGQWIFKMAYVSTNTKYVVSGEQNLRLQKNGSYVVTPVLDKGVKTVEFNCRRSGKGIDVYTSTDGGKSWEKAGSCTSAQEYVLTVDNPLVNRVKIANDASKDADIDDLVVTATAFGVEAQISTGDATNITKNSADLSGQLIDAGDQPIQEMGMVWSPAANPTVGDAKEAVENLKETSFTLNIDGLQAQTLYHYRAYAVSNAGTVYGEDRTFTTAAATPAVVVTGDLTQRNGHYEASGTVADDGGAALLEVGVAYSTTPGLSYEQSQKVAAKLHTSFRVELPLEAGETYYYCAYAVTSVGVSLGQEKQVTIDDNIPDTPDTTEKIWCSPDGDDATADGTEQHPFYSLDRAIALVEPGMRICMKAGTYVYDHRINIDNHNGTPDQPIELFAVDGRAVLDFSAMPYHKHSDNPLQGVRLTSSYWHFYRIDITNASDNGLLIERNKPTGGSNADIIAATEQGHHNLIEECNFYRNGDTGLQIKNLGAWNQVINCDSYENCDEGEGDADGFAPKISVGDGNYFYGCRAWLNSDDGWDVFFKKDGGFGDNMTIVMENCVSYKNGFLDLNTIAPDGNGNGYKCGSNQGAMNVYMNRCLAICNKAKGFDQNHNAGDIVMNNCTGMTLKSISDKSYSYRIYEQIADDHEVRLTNCIAINDNDATDKRDKNTGLPKEGEHGKYGQYGRFEVDTTLQRLSIVSCEFQKADPTQFVDITNHEELIAPRHDDGSLPETTFAHLRKGSFLIDAGTKIGATNYRGIDVDGISYKGTAPDLGAYEYTDETAVGIARLERTESDRTLALRQTQSGLLLLQVAQTNEPLVAKLYDGQGRLLGQHTFEGGSTALRLPRSARGMAVLRVEGSTFKASAKALLR
jgi:hypothetical protein